MNTIYQQNLVYAYGYESWDMINYSDIKKNTYAISTFGRVMNVITNHILSPFVSNSGYWAINLRCEGNGRDCGTFLIHR